MPYKYNLNNNEYYSTNRFELLRELEDQELIETLREDSPEEVGLNESLVGSQFGSDLISSEYDDDEHLEPSLDKLHFACTNARSVVEKVPSLVTLFEENSLHFAILTETWLTKKSCPPRMLDDLTTGSNVSFIRRDRGRRGGGVAICYNHTKVRLKPFSTGNEPRGAETVCAVGSVTLTDRKIAIMSVYLPPSMNRAEVEIVLASVIDTINKVKIKFDNPILFIGGDFNKKNMRTLVDAFPELMPIQAGATRGGAALDEVYCNISRCVADKQIQHPLSKENGVVSDHHVIVASAKLPRHRKSRKETITFRPITSRGTEKFRSLLLDTDWSQIQCQTSSESAKKLTDLLNSMIEECFPEKTRKIKQKRRTLV